MYSAIPEELKELEQWCGFKLQKRGEKMTKIPVDAKTGGPGKSNDETTWSNFDEAIAAVDKFNLDGIGFYFKEPYFGIDIDNVKPEIERYKAGDHEDNIVSEFIDMMCSYAEYSVSGNGLHIIVKGDLPQGGRRKANVEMYDSGRFFVMTGNSASSYTRIAEDDYGKIGYLHNKYIAQPEVSEQVIQDSLQTGTDLSEDDIIRIASGSKTGARFQFFLTGGWEQFYDSQSEADMAFANDLAFWTNRDYSMMDSIFRRSSLYREKWERKQNDSTYGAETLNKAIAECRNSFQPKPKEGAFNLYLLDDEVKEIKQKYYSFDDTGNAERFTDRFGEVLRYSYIRKNWYYYDGKLWALDQEGKVKTLADEAIKLMKNEKLYTSEEMDEEEVQKAFQKHLKATRNNRGKTNMIKESEHLLPIGPNHFDSDPNLLNVQNGYIELSSGTLHGHDRKKFFTKISNVEYTDKIDCPLWMDFLHQIFGGDRQLIDYMQRAVGYSLSGSTEEQVMFVLHGHGRNGKSVFLDIITELFGNYSTNIQPQTIMVKQQSSGANSDIARLNGARLVTTTEPNEGVRLDEGLVKQLTGGDKVTARFLYGDEFEFDPEFKLWMATNHKPIIRGTDDGIWRRMVIIPFTIQIPEAQVDKNLKNKLKRELTAILNWAVEGHQLWKLRGLDEPQIIKDQRTVYRTEMDGVKMFIDECCETREGERAKSSELYQIFKDWAQENGQYKMSHTKFGREMSQHFEKITNNGVYYVGLKLKEEYENTFFRLGY